MTKKYPKLIIPKSNYKFIETSTLPRNIFFIRATRKKSQIKTLSKLKKISTRILSASEFPNGISCNLYSVFDERHSCFNVKDPNNRKVISDWLPNKNSIMPEKDEYEYLPWQGYFGFQLSKIKEFESTISIKKEGKVIRRDKCVLRVIHSPTNCNFWHFNLYLFAINSVTDKEYNLNDKEEGISKSQIQKIATSLIDGILPYLSLGRNLKKKYIAKNIYMI